MGRGQTRTNAESDFGVERLRGAFNAQRNPLTRRVRLSRFALVASFIAALAFPAFAHASSGGETEAAIGATLLAIVVLLLAGKISSLVERFGQPAVLGELIAGVILGNLALVGITIFEPIKHDAMIRFLAQLGVVVLLFQVGLESNIATMIKVGVRAFLVACVGVALPFALALFVVAPFLLPGLSFNAYLFIGATLTATSVGITARVFRDLGKLQTSEAQIVLGAAVIDDVLGLIILAVVSAIVTTGTASVLDITIIVLKAFLFLAGAVVIGQLLAPRLGRFFSRIQTGIGMKFTFAISFGLFTAFLAERIGLAPIVGAFAAGLVLDAVHFSDFDDPHFAQDLREKFAHTDEKNKAALDDFIKHHSDRHIQDLLEPIGFFLAPIFFVLTGMEVNLATLFNVEILLVALAITIVAFAGKIAAGLVAGKVDKWVVGVGMIPRGEVGLIFAATGKALGVVNDQIFSMIVIVVILSTLLTPPILAYLLKRK
ncbi:MAG: cation:proton antiporter [Chloroflexi bacterium]|nr:cation:proton antiporter [Chloroflexota bacterium]